MSPKLIFLDIDGTLTMPGSNEPPQSALEAIRAAQRKGNLVFLCSGRNPGMLEPLLKYGFDGVIACAGGYVTVGDELIYDMPMKSFMQRAFSAPSNAGTAPSATRISALSWINTPVKTAKETAR